ncbi:MAG TPA: hypothetical protein VF551_02895 [Chthoniobacterales bacterium]|jgi:hypothetical protein
MKRRFLSLALTVSALAFTFALTGCSTTQSRIAERPEVYNRMSSSDQALVTNGRIREGMSRDAVYIAWGAPNESAPGRNRGSSVETWIYYATTSGDYYPGPFYYGYPFGYGVGFGHWGGRRGRLYRHHLFYDPFYDPFFYNRVSLVRYPERTVSFQNGRVVAYQLLPAPRIF